MRFSVLLAGAFLPFPALSQQTITLDPIILSAGLNPIEAHSYGRAHTVVTADEIEARGLASVQDALRAVPGVAVSSTGPSYTQVRIRGAEANHTLVLIDGVRAAAGDSEYILTGLETANIERIEVLRGPQSVFWGADAAAGVVNIVTRRDTVGTGAGGSVEFGNGWAASARASTRTETGGLSFSASTRDDRGFDYSDTPGGDRDGIRRHTLSFSGDHAIGDFARAGFTLRRANERYEYDTTSYTATTAEEYLIDSDDFANRREFGGQLWVEAETLDGRLTHRLSYDQSRFQISRNDGPWSRARTQELKYRATYGIDGAVAAANQTLAFGLERRQDENTVAPEQNRRSISGILEYRGSFDRLDVQAGLRRDNNDVFRDATTWSVGLSYTLPQQGMRVHASAGTGIVNPSYLELFGGWGATGNPNLRPEENRSFDIGLEAEIMDGRGLVDLTYFHEDMENEITYSGVPLANGTNYFNQSGTSTRRGVELSGRVQVTDNLRLGASYTYLRAKNPDGSVEIRRPRHEFGLNAEYAFAQGRGTIAGDLRHVTGNYDTQWFGAYGTEELPSYTVVNVAAGYDLTDNARLTGRITNLFDSTHSDAWGYIGQRRTAWIGLESRW
ncbi:MAG: TonB-dependent receptor [Paracoccus sp. (in: a-proteobacteria)]|uniref:TonB-dependent receptor plug domain-containing protein n=1 Tax=Paracoccus sp. TaxID=267 RepID=UPI0026DFC93B|nr:TonB-dependent receptor [Paracoccus sp. (in: a-proteobacteria)]MDO5622795.1 TonB-dependent receptor [Paracoccus sp. (in: a-proteobacteria)]